MKAQCQTTFLLQLRTEFLFDRIVYSPHCLILVFVCVSEIYFIPNSFVNKINVRNITIFCFRLIFILILLGKLLLQNQVKMHMYLFKVNIILKKINIEVRLFSSTKTVNSAICLEATSSLRKTTAVYVLRLVNSSFTFIFACTSLVNILFNINVPISNSSTLL